jgi:signal transduction histidine kinase/ligand-binding sensor domain-containing protein
MNNIKAKINFLLRVSLTALTFLILFGIQNIYSQQNKYKFDRLITNQENFPQEINCVIKDKKGFMWFGTDYGLYRFDGYNFKVYTFKFGDSATLSTNMISCIYDDDRYLWVGAVQGLNRFDKTTERFKQFKLSINDNFIHGIYPSANNELWIRTAGGLNKIDSTKDKYIKSTGFGKDTLNAMISEEPNTLLEDDEGNLWIGTSENGLYKYDLKNKTFKNYKFNPEDSNSLSNNDISKILEDKKGNLWISTYSGGFNKLDIRSEKFKRFQHNSLNSNSIVSDTIYHMVINIDETLWIGTSGGISVFDPHTDNFINLQSDANLFSLSDISDLYCDNVGAVWICSPHEYGFIICNTLKWKFDYYKNLIGDNDSLTYNAVTSVGEDHQGNYWIGTPNGIDVLNKKKTKIRHFDHDPKDSTSLGNEHVLNIYKDKKNFMWIGSWYGPLDRYDADKDMFTHYYDLDGEGFRPFQIIEDKKENLWIGLGEAGIRVLDSSRTVMKVYLDKPVYTNVNITDIFEDSKKNIWIGSRLGLATIDLMTDSIIFHNPNDSNTSIFYVLGINEDESGYLWVGTTNGLYSFDITSKTYQHFNNIKDGGRDDIIGLMRDAKGNFWSTIDKGITMFNINNKTFTNYGVSDGFQVNTFNIKPQQYKALDGEMFFAGSKGLTSFYPDSIPQNKNIPTIVLTDFRIFNNEVKLDTSIVEIKKITISYKENFFSFDYAALDYTNPIKNQYAYMLEGIDKDWNYVGNQMSANYTDIEPGEYTFRVKGSNNDGVWNEEGTSIKVSITPPWWQAWWFKSCGAALIFMTAGYGYKKRVNKLKKDKTAQEEFSKKLLNSQEEERKKIASVLHDSIAHDVLITKNSSEIGIRSAGENEEVKEILNKISEQSSSTLNELRRIQFNLHPYEVEKLGLTKAIKSIVDRVSKSSEIEFTIEEDFIDKTFSEENEIHLYRIIQEAINNIIKHSSATEADIRIVRTEENIFIIISDNGKGFSKNYALRMNSMGLSGISERVKLLGGNMEIESESGNGTILKINLPLSSF